MKPNLIEILARQERLMPEANNGKTKGRPFRVEAALVRMKRPSWKISKIQDHADANTITAR